MDADVARHAVRLHPEDAGQRVFDTGRHRDRAPLNAAERPLGHAEYVRLRRGCGDLFKCHFVALAWTASWPKLDSLRAPSGSVNVPASMRFFRYWNV